MKYEKPFKTYEEQADLLLARGMVANRAYLVQHLQDVGYYRLSGYWHVFKRSDDTFREGTSFEKVWDLYTFDRQFKLITLDAIERVEIYLRTQLAYELAKVSGPFGYADLTNLPNLDECGYSKLMNRFGDAFDRSREPFALHFKNVYGDMHKLPPYWVLVNLTDFGMTFSLYRGAPDDVRKAISRAFGIEPKVMDSWLMTINTTRNICAHHGRLWNRVLGTKPRIPRKKNDSRWHVPYEVDSGNVFVVLTILSHMLEIVAPDTAWRERLFGLLSSRSTEELQCMGFGSGWKTCPIWSKWISFTDSANKC